ncbi:MAG: CPBP family intramembrane glutamic endopeptidase [Candidatus Acidiferrales bacterium]
MKNDSRNDPVTPFVILTFVCSWLVWELSTLAFAKETLYLRVFAFRAHTSILQILYWLGFLAPGIVALSLVFISKGVQGVGRFIRRGFQWRVHVRVYLYAFFIPLLIGFAFTIESLLARNIPIHVSHLSLALLDFAVNLLFGALFEEIGWRGYLLPRLQSNSTGLRASLLLGIIWGMWHLPVRISFGSVTFAGFCLLTCGITVILTWLYNLSNGSLIPVILFHSTVNSVATFVVEPMASAYGMRSIWANVALVWAAALIVLFVAGPNLGKVAHPQLGDRGVR